MTFKSGLKTFGWTITSILSLTYIIGFVAAIINYSEISHWLGTSSRIGGVFTTIFQIWIWITGIVLLYMGYKKVTGGTRRNENGRS